MRCCGESMASEGNIQPRRFGAMGLMLSKSAMDCGEAPSKLNSAVKARDGDFRHVKNPKRLYMNITTTCKTQASHLSTPLWWWLRPSRSMSIMYASGRWHHTPSMKSDHAATWTKRGCWRCGVMSFQSWNREEFSFVSKSEFVQLVAMSEQPNAINTISVGTRIE